MKNIVCLISGRGSNLQALLNVAQAQDWPATLSTRIAAVISNRPQAAGLAFAQAAGIATQALDHTSFASREAFDTALAQAIDVHEPALVVLAGFMRVLTAPFVDHYRGRLINIHPSLLPSFPGLATHRQAIESGVRVHGATVHYVSAEVDAGAVIGQAVVPVQPDDTEDTLAARVLTHEHILLPRCVRLILEGKVGWREVEGRGRVWCAPEVVDELRVLP